VKGQKARLAEIRATGIERRKVMSAKITFLVLAVFALGATARAQTYQQGSFVLPYPVQWQTATLPAGECTFKVQNGGMAKTVISIRDTRQPNGKVLTVPAMTTHFSGKSSLVIVTVNGKRYVRSLQLAPLDTAFTYLVPKPNAEERIEEAARILPVRTSAE
jgi:hypothetical protein